MTELSWAGGRTEIREQHRSGPVLIVFGSEGQAQKVHYLAHVIKRAKNFDQLLTVEFEQPQLIANGKIMVLGRADQVDLKPKAGEKVKGQIDGATVEFTVTKQVYFDIRNAEGFGDAY